jgi:hypothetical protein
VKKRSVAVLVPTGLITSKLSWGVEELVIAPSDGLLSTIFAPDDASNGAA